MIARFPQCLANFIRASFFVAISLVSLTAIAQENQVYQIGDPVEVNHHGTWYRGQVSRIGPNELVWVRFREPTFGVMESFFEPDEIRTGVPQIKYRSWKSAGGNFRVRAKLESVSKKSVKLRRQDNSKTVEVAIAKLSDEDKQYLQPFLS